MASETELRFTPEKHLFYTDGDIEATYYPSTKQITLQKVDGSRYVAFNFKTISELVDYIRELNIA